MPIKLSVIVALVLTTPVGADETLRQKFLSNYETPAAAIREFYEGTEFKCRMYQVKDGKKIYADTVRGFFAPGGWRAESGNQTMVRNKDYVFTASKDKDGKTVMKDVATTTKAPTDRSFFLAPYYDTAVGRLYLDIIKDPATTVLEFESGKLKVRFPTPHPERGDILDVTRTYRFHTPSWVCLGWNDGYVEDRYEYNDREPVPALTAASRWTINPEKQLFGLDSAEFKPGGHDASELRPAALGLEEPDFAQESSNRFYWFAICIFVLGVTLAWLLTRKRRP